MAVSVTSVTGTISHGQSITINGSGFGTKSSAKPYLWAPFDNGDLTLSSLGIKTGSWTGTSYVQYASDGGYNNSPCMRDHLTSRPSGGDGWTAYIDTQADWVMNTLSQKSYTFRKIKKNFVIMPSDNTGDTDGSTGVITGMTDTSDFFVGDYVSVNKGFPSTGQVYCILSKTATSITLNANSNSVQSNVTVRRDDNWKILRVWHTGIAYPNFYYAAGNGNLATEASSSTYCWSYGDLGSYVHNNTNWRTEEFIIEGNTTLVDSDGYFLYRCNNVKMCTSTDNDYYFGIRDEAGSAHDMNWPFLVHGVMANYSTFPHDWDHEYYDDIYFDNTWSRVMIGNNQTYANCTNLEIQIPSAWSDSSVTVTMNAGIYTNETVYLFVFDSEGNVNASGYEITFGTGYSQRTLFRP